MNTRKSIRNAVCGVVIAGLCGGAQVWAGHEAAGETGRPSDPALVYTSKAFSQAIYSYLNLEGAEKSSWNPLIVYVDQAYGQAIYSYPRVGRDTVASFNVHYVNQAYGPAIYSYPGLEDVRGNVEVLPAWMD
jgi:hypothetical protein